MLLRRVCPVLFCSAALAIANSYDFSTFALGDIQGQSGFGYSVNSYIGGTVTAAPAGSLWTQALQFYSRESTFNGVVNGVYTPRSEGSGEPGTPGSVSNEFAASIWYRTPDSAAAFVFGDPILQMNPSFAPAGGGCCADRYARLALTANATEFRVYSSWPTADSFTDRTFFATLAPGAWYNFLYDAKFLPGLNADGSPNDTVRLTVKDANGNLVGSMTAYSWESGWATGSYNGVKGARSVNAFDFETFTASEKTDLGMLGSVEFGPVVTAVPEPSTIALTAFGAAALALRRRTR